MLSVANPISKAIFDDNILTRSAVTHTSQKAVLLLSCPDRIGLVSRISNFIFERRGNILDLDEHVDIASGMFFIRVSWSRDDVSITTADLQGAFSPLALELGADWKIYVIPEKPRVAVFVSRYDHCLQDLLWRYKTGEFAMEIPLIISNHRDLEDLAAQYSIPFHVFPKTRENKLEQETKELELLKENRVDTVVLARYMQVLSQRFVDAYPDRIINIHHSFLPAFSGGSPYKQAFERGVKIIGATSHYVTGELDEGPIIEQDIIRITHKDTLGDLIRKGRDLERLVLSRAISSHIDHRVLVNGRKTIIFT
ncbi:MAG: formyltetrahydrofolate deformylase [Prosthecochloris sp.]|nr:formyltetrahydrofolate deformylase [Prosthecochloris sp.]